MRFVRNVCPEIARIIKQISDYFCKTKEFQKLSSKELCRVKILQGSTVHMAHMACCCSSHINGVAQLHTNLLKETVLSTFYKIYPKKFINVTNGITQRRWLGVCNPELSKLITKLIGSDK